MKYSDIKIVENSDGEMRAIAQPLIKYFTRNCNDDRRINQQLTNLRKNLETYPEKIPGVVRHLPRILANLVSNTVYPIRLSGAEVSQIKLDGFSLPLYRKEMCVTGAGRGDGDAEVNQRGSSRPGQNGNGNTTGQNGDGNTTGQNGDGENGNGENGSGGVASVADTFSSEMGTFEGLIDQSDWDGAIAFLDANPEFEGSIGSSFRSDIQGKIDASAAVERNRIAQEKAEQEAQEAEDAAAEEAAQAAAKAAEEAASIAAEEAQARIDTIKAERDAQAAIRAAEKVEAARLEAEAEKRRQDAEQLERDRIAAEEEASYLTQNQVESNIKMTQKAMEKAAKEFDFVEAAKLRDHLKLLKKQVVS